MNENQNCKTHVLCDECGQELYAKFPIFGMKYKCNECSKQIVIRFNHQMLLGIIFALIAFFGVKIMDYYEIQFLLQLSLAILLALVLNVTLFYLTPLLLKKGFLYQTYVDEI